MEGWVSIYRTIQDHWIWQDEKHLKWWLCILLNVNHTERKFPVGTEMHICKPGQSFRSIEQWTDMFSCSKKTTLKFFQLLEDDGMIIREIVGSGNRRKHLLSVANWKEYQQAETENSTETVPEFPPKQYPNIPPNNNDNNGNNETKKKSTFFDFKAALLGLGVSEQTATDWLKVRATKKATNTETAFKIVSAQINISGITSEECIRTAIEKNWQGFRAEWLKTDKSKHSANSIFNNALTQSQVQNF